MKPASSAINSLYILKCLFAFLVVTCHTPMGAVKVMLQPIAMGAVCVFFLISGYFLYSPQAEKSYQRAVKSLRSTVKIFLVVSLFYWAWLLPNNGNLLNSFAKLWSLLLTGSLFSGHTWYLMAMIQGLIVLALVFRLGIQRYIWDLTPLCIFGLLGSQYSFLLTDERADYYYYVYTSISYSILSALGVALAYGERALLFHAGYDYAAGALFGSFVTAVLIFIWALQHKSFGAGTWAETIGAKYSGNIYYFHIAVATIISKALYAAGMGPVYEQLGSALVFVGSIAVAYVIVRLQDKIGIHILK